MTNKARTEICIELYDDPVLCKLMYDNFAKDISFSDMIKVLEKSNITNNNSGHSIRGDMNVVTDDIRSAGNIQIITGHKGSESDEKNIDPFELVYNRILKLPDKKRGVLRNLVNTISVNLQSEVWDKELLGYLLNKLKRESIVVYLFVLAAAQDFDSEINHDVRAFVNTLLNDEMNR